MTCFRPDGHLTDAALTALVRGDGLEELDRLDSKLLDEHYHPEDARMFRGA